MTWIIANSAIIFGFLFFVSEALALVPGVASNSVFQMIQNALKAAVAPAAPKA